MIYVPIEGFRRKVANLIDTMPEVTIGVSIAYERFVQGAGTPFFVEYDVGDYGHKVGRGNISEDEVLTEEKEKLLAANVSTVRRIFSGLVYLSESLSSKGDVDRAAVKFRKGSAKEIIRQIVPEKKPAKSREGEPRGATTLQFPTESPTGYVPRV